MDTRPPVMAGSRDRYGDLFDYMRRLGFSPSDSDLVAYDLPQTWDGMDALPKAVKAYFRRRLTIPISETGRHIVAELLIKWDAE